MSWNRPNPTYTRMELPSYSIGTITNTTPTLLSEAQGRAREGGRVMFQVSGAATITLYLWAPATSTWMVPSSSSASYQKTFAAAGMDYFDAPEGARFYLKASSSVTCYADCDPPTPPALR